MHRVELKASLMVVSPIASNVPNAPCGVESRSVLGKGFSLKEFLMHRVELKVGQAQGAGVAVPSS